jgi:hypothetical protein
VEIKKKMPNKIDSQNLTLEQRRKRLQAALHHYYKTADALPGHPKMSECTVEADGTVTLINTARILAKLRVDDSGRVEELDFDPFDGLVPTDFDIDIIADEQDRE